jgi:TolB-like protein/Flp pilus assembly protein TadD
LLYRFEDYALDVDRRELRRGNDLIPLEPQVFDLLVYLVRNRDRVVSRDDLIAAIWGGRIVSESALNTRINAVRNAIGDNGGQQRLIKTLPRKGVRFIAAVDERGNHETTDAPLAASTESGRALFLPDKPSIAVLAFANMSGEPEQQYFADGVSEEIITALSRCNWLFVIARNSSFTYKGVNVDIRQVGRQLGVRYVLEGSVRRSSDRLRITGQLIDATTGVHLWADRFEGAIADVFDLQDQITENVVAAIEPKLQLAEIERLKTKPAASFDAYELLLRAQQFEYECSMDSLRAALRCLGQALAIDPDYALAMALAAYCYGEREHQGWTEDATAETAEGLRLAARAVELGRDDGNVLWMAAHATLRLAKDRERAKELAYGSLVLNPNSAVAMSIAGLTEVMSGNARKALELLLRAQRLSPRDPRGWLFSATLALAYLTDENFDMAITSAKKALMHNPRFGAPLRVLAASYALIGQREKAAEIVRQHLTIDPQLSLSKLRARLLFMDERVWTRLAQGLRLAGLPE